MPIRQELHRPRTSRSAFTLVELLVVIGIIALLVGILLPALNKARGSANMLKCASNLRQIGIAMQLYSHQYQGRLPATYMYPQTYTAGPVSGSGLAVYWWQRLMIDKLLPGINDPNTSVAVCPSQEVPFQPFTNPGEDKLFRSSYGINNFMSIHDGASWAATPNVVDGKDDISPVSFGVRLAEWPKVNHGKDSSDKVLAGDLGYGYMLDPWEPNTTPITNPPTWHEIDWRRHAAHNAKLGRCNILFLDGHVTVVNQGTDAANVFSELCGMASPPNTPSTIAKAKQQWLP